MTHQRSVNGLINDQGWKSSSSVVCPGRLGQGRIRDGFLFILSRQAHYNVFLGTEQLKKQKKKNLRLMPRIRYRELGTDEKRAK